MLGGEVRQGSAQDIQMVLDLIDQYLPYYMSQKEVTQMLLDKEKIEPIITELVWQNLEEQNQEFFRAYHLRVMLKEQIMEFNRLLQRQAERICQVAHEVSFAPMSNGSHVPPMHQRAAYCAQQNSGPALRTEHMRQHVTTNPSMRNASDMYVHSGRFGVPSNMQNSNVGMLNGGMLKTEAGYGSKFMYGAAGLETRPPIGNAPISSFSSVESYSQPMNETLLDGTSSLEPWRNFSLSDLTDIGHTPGILDSYTGSPFRETLLDSHDGIEEHHGDNRRSNTISKG